MAIYTTVSVVSMMSASCQLTFYMAAYARYSWTRYKQFVIYRAVRCVADWTAFTHSRVFEDKWAFLLFVALETFFILTEQHRPAGGPYIFSMHIVACGTEHPSFRHRVMML